MELTKEAMNYGTFSWKVKKRQRKTKEKSWFQEDLTSSALVLSPIEDRDTDKGWMELSRFVFRLINLSVGYPPSMNLSQTTLVDFTFLIDQTVRQFGVQTIFSCNRM